MADLGTIGVQTNDTRGLHITVTAVSVWRFPECVVGEATVVFKPRRPKLRGIRGS